MRPERKYHMVVIQLYDGDEVRRETYHKADNTEGKGKGYSRVWSWSARCCVGAVSRCDEFLVRKSYRTSGGSFRDETYSEDRRKFRDGPGNFVSF